jgi:ribonucleoside-diphosphate reductase alpha chain
VNQNTVFFHDLKEKLDYLVENDYYSSEVIAQYSFRFIKSLFKRAYAKKFRFETFFGAFKFYRSYALKTRDGQRYLERFEDRICMVALTLAEGNEQLAMDFVDEMISGRYQPATPTFLNTGKKNSGELVSCFLVRAEDSMNSISRAIDATLQLSKIGGGVALLLTNLREPQAPIRGVEGQASGIIPVMKQLEGASSYANQLGARDGAAAVYLNVHHPEIMKFLDTKRENADEAIRIKKLSLGVVIPDITLELAARNEDMYLFSPYDVAKVYGKPMSDISITEHYYDMVDNPKIKKYKINARKLFERIAEIQFESGYPYMMFEDTVNRASPIAGRINMSNLCSEILQVNTPSHLGRGLHYEELGKDISCNLGSLNIAKTMDSPDFGKTIETSIRALTAVSNQSKIFEVQPIMNGNNKSHAVGLGAMNLHGYLARERMYYGSEEALDFTNMFFYLMAYHAVKTSNLISQETGIKFEGFENSKYASGEYFEKYITREWKPVTKRVEGIFKASGIHLPTKEDWQALKLLVQKFGIYNQNLMAIPPTGSISYINNSTSCIHPIIDKVETRKEGKTGRCYYPAAYMTNENIEYYESAYDIGPKKIIDTYAVATQHVDQGLSLTLFVKETATTRDLTRAAMYAYSKGIKTIYYWRVRQSSLEGTEVQGCVSCSL